MPMTDSEGGAPEPVQDGPGTWVTLAITLTVQSMASMALLVLPVSCTKSASADEAAVRSFLATYFSTWSVKDMDSYGACFHPQARITFVGKNGETQTDGLTDFLHGQKLAHAQSATPMSESPTSLQLMPVE